MKIFKLKDISEFIRNGVTIKQDISSKEGIPITRIETISKGTIDFNKLGYANIFEIEKYKEWLLKKGDILISHINSEKHLGKSAIYLDNNYDIIHGMNLLCIRAIDKKVFPEYLQLFFKTNQYKKQIKKITKKSVNQASFSVNDFKEILITVPDLNIQEKIIKKIKVLEKILENNKLKLDYLSELTKSLFTRMFGDIRTNSKNWETKKIDECILNNIENINLKINGEIAYIDISSINNKENKIFSYKIYNNINEAPSRAKKILNEGDILISTVRPNLKNIAILNNKILPLTIGSTGFCVLRFKDIINNKYIFEIIKSDNFTEMLVKKQIGANYPAISDRNIKLIEIPVPPIELQNKFAERVEKIEKLSFEIEKSIKEAENLYNSLINKYFD